jgi:hypothetical protein
MFFISYCLFVTGNNHHTYKRAEFKRNKPGTKRLENPIIPPSDNKV